MLKRFFAFILEKFCLILISVSILLFPPFTKFLFSNNENEKITISINGYNLIVEVADTAIKRTIGLMFRENLDWNNGMLFVFSKPEYASFWMKNTKIALSLAFIDKNGVITELLDLKPFDLRSKTSKNKISYVLEVNQGWFWKNGSKVGDIVKGLTKKSESK